MAASTKNSSRRALLVGALGGIGAVAAGVVGRVGPVRAEDENIVVGGEYTTAQSQTRLRNQTNSATVFKVESAASGIAIDASSQNFIGVFGSSQTDLGVYGFSNTYTAIYGASNATGLPAMRAIANGNSTGLLGSSGDFAGAKPKTGVYGYANQDATSRGVWGYSGRGQGVRGATGRGVGVYGKANQPNGFAFRGSGRVGFDRISGVATIAKGNVSVLVHPGVNVTSGAFVLLTPRANIGSRSLWYTTNASADTVTVHMSSARSSATKVAWLLLG